MRTGDAPVILAQHGIDPDADAETLTVALEVRGRSVTAEEAGIGRARRYTAHATRVRNNPSDHYFPIIREVVRATGSTPARALAVALAKALEKEWERSGSCEPESRT
ncbi:MAG: hypothetical protein M3R02_01955 [Chloroflexota bacterium]|nr:hypothetical protein [Chloroflexota bacterium]